MDLSYLFELAGFFLRWLHVVTAIAWIGASFHFVMLDNSLTSPSHQDLKNKGVGGEMWAVHGGGFYHSNKYATAPRWLPLPEKLHWSFWESYSTWLTGFGLFTVMYLFNAGTFLIDSTVHAWSPAAAISTAMALLLGFWLAYDAICRVFGQGRNGDVVVAASVGVLVVAACWLTCNLFAGRAAFLIVGAMVATAMSANVLFWIIPGQRKVVSALRAGQEPDPIHGKRGKQRSVHNTYFTLPVLVAMISNHYGWLYQGPANWLVLAVLMFSSALIRHSFVARHRALAQGRQVRWTHALIGLVALLAFALWLAPSPLPSPASASTAPITASAASIGQIVDQRCVMCHNADVRNKNVSLHTTDLIHQHAQQIYQQTVVLKSMPLNNATQITDAERIRIKVWFESGMAGK